MYGGCSMGLKCYFQKVGNVFYQQSKNWTYQFSDPLEPEWASGLNKSDVWSAD